MKVPTKRPLQNLVKRLRLQRGWTQADLAQRTGVSRPAISAIEIQRLIPSVAVALSLAAAFECRVEELFIGSAFAQRDTNWAWPPTSDPCRFWHADVGNKTVLYPVEPTTSSLLAHDGIFRNGVISLRGSARPERTLVMATCDPAAGLLAEELARTSDYRLLVIPRASRPALDLLRAGLVHLAGIHLTTKKNEGANAEVAKAVLGSGHTLLTVASWQEGLTLGNDVTMSSVASLLRTRLRWIGREEGSGARQCQDEVLRDRPSPRRLARDHRGVAEAIRNGWADVGVCVRLVSEEAGLKFIGVREEAYQLCYPNAFDDDPRMRALLQVIRSRSYRGLLSELPGYDCRHLGEVACIR